jgi:hypothetical protein
MQFTKTFVTLALAVSAIAVPTGSGGGGSTPPSSGAQCCQNVTNSSSIKSTDPLGLLLGLLGIVVSNLNVPIGTGCTPIDILGGVSCNTNTVQCGSVYARKFSVTLVQEIKLIYCPSAQLIGINCIPVTLNT